MNFLQSLAEQFAGKPIDWDELEESLIRADLGVLMTTRIIKTLQEREAWSLLGISDVIKAARQEIARILPTNPAPIRPIPNKPKVILLLGVNGTGKTTSTAKLARYLQQDRHGVLLAAADTFRAAAIEQLGVWAKKLGVEMVRGHYNTDPAAICYEAYQAAVRRKIDFLLCDTAGRQHTKANLMAELQGEAHPFTTRTRRTRRCWWWMQRPVARAQSGTRIPERNRRHRSHRCQTRGRQGGVWLRFRMSLNSTRLARGERSTIRDIRRTQVSRTWCSQFKAWEKHLNRRSQ
jgi:hypothetical protein